ncbi:hypothetical protein GCM10027291_02130 [Telluribacter humicola]
MDPKGGGTSESIRTLIPTLQRRGINNEVVCLDSPSADYVHKEAFKVHALGEWKGAWAYNIELPKWLNVNLYRYDYVFVHGLWQYQSFITIRTILNYRRSNGLEYPKVYIMPHGMLDPYFQKASGRRLKAIRNWLYWKVIESKTVNEADGIVFTCEKELHLARLPFRPYQPKREINIGFGIIEPPAYTTAMSEAFASKCPDLNNRPYILFLSRINEKKGVDLFINAYAKLIQDPKNNQAELPVLVIAGPGIDTPYGQYIQDLVYSNEGMKNRVFFPGMINGDAKWGALYGCDTFILPSHQENFGIAVVEALACAKPVLISNQINICEEIERSGSGFVADNTTDGTYQLLETWHRLTESKRASMAMTARTTFNDLFYIERCIDRLMEKVMDGASLNLNKDAVSIATSL